MNNWKYYKPEIIGVLVACASLNLWYLLSLAIEHRVIPSTFDYLINAVIIFSSVCLGSYSAFKLNDIKDIRKQYQLEVDVINSTIFRLMRQFNLLARERNDLDKVRNRSERAFLLPATISPFDDDIKYNISNLEFMLKGSDKELLFDLALEQDRFNAAIASIKLRAEYHFNRVQPILERENFSISNPTLLDFENIIGFPLVSGLINQTNSVYDHVYNTCDSMIEVRDRLLQASKELFPNEQFFGFEIES